MEKKTYYRILGVPSTESPSGISAAYRALAKKLHPDGAGEGAMRAFQEATEAYDVLSEAGRRREYNSGLRRAEERDSGRVIMPREARSHGPAEPLLQKHSILGHPDGIRPSFEAMVDRFLRNFTGIGIPKSERLEGLNFQVLLTPDEVARGAVVAVSVPVFHRCPQCQGSGRDWVYPCSYCREQGFIETEQVVRVGIPPLTPPGFVLEILLDDLGIHNFYLRLHVFVQK